MRSENDKNSKLVKSQNFLKQASLELDEALKNFEASETDPETQKNIKFREYQLQEIKTQIELIKKQLESLT